MNDPQGVGLDRTRARLSLCGADKGVTPLSIFRKEVFGMFSPSKRVLIDADLFFDLYTFVYMASSGNYEDLFDVETEAAELLPKVQAKLDGMIARKEYAERIDAEKGSR